ncbi:S46 family peptidase [Moheibacter sediminis]|uniref:Dipeptidyl-peptidase n=1 Tax=Moheibacter sediminis TaxID=1434700 RepID=A0A1W2AHE2_9FLAO|nr:S46 family peptidase [Moheibacter sediminis]SMC60115.1 Peptidase S46 [Moheibacter sediminis]
MKKLIVLITGITFLLSPFKVKADEGMWFLMFIGKNIDDMQKKGLKLSAEEIYSINNSSLKDAIVQFGGGCTAEIISSTGLVLTNHHCGYGNIAELSTPENDHLTNGFWASDYSKELKPKNLKVRFFVRMDDVSKRILGKVNDKMTEDERMAAINQEIAKIEQENNEGGKYVVSVRSFFEGNEYYYFVYQDFQDVRLVGTPPDMIGRFGGDTDNWEWPRHTGDFSLFRVYTDKNGNPADYSTSNVPMKPKHHLPVSLAGYKDGDFSMILGYPGRTNRWMPAGGVEQNINFAYPAWVEGSKLGMDVLKKYMDKDQKVKLDYASKYAGLANYWKNRAGMIDALKQHKTVDSKRKTEKDFTKWAQRGDKKAKYGDAVEIINNYYSKTNETARHDNYLMTMLRSSTFAALPANLGKTLEQYASENAAKRAEMRPGIEEMINGIFEGAYMPLEEDMLASQLNLYYTKAAKGGLAPYVKELGGKLNGNFKDYVNKTFATSIFTKKDQLLKYLDNPVAATIQGDELYKLSGDLMTRYRAETAEEKALADAYQKSFRLLVEGLRESGLSPIEYPDANSTLRLTYGKVVDLPLGKKVNDAKFNYFTTLKGTIAKHKKGDDEFDAPQKLIDLYNKKDYGQYADKSGELWVNFLTDHDITGGNSGSPVLNGKGELIGLAFDGNIEAMAGDVIFDPKLQRTISVDIRYVLFVIDKYAGAKNIIDELTLVK